MSADEARDQWAPYMFRNVSRLPYHSYAGDAPRWWTISKRNRAFELRRALSLAFLDRRPDEEIAEVFCRLYATISEGGDRGGAPPWQSVLAHRSLQPGERESYRGAFEW
jgi:hypothetical protein